MSPKVSYRSRREPLGERTKWHIGRRASGHWATTAPLGPPPPPAPAERGDESSRRFIANCEPAGAASVGRLIGMLASCRLTWWPAELHSSRPIGGRWPAADFSIRLVSLIRAARSPPPSRSQSVVAGAVSSRSGSRSGSGSWPATCGRPAPSRVGAAGEPLGPPPSLMAASFGVACLGCVGQSQC